MGISPYKEMLPELLERLKSQTIQHEVVVSSSPIERWIPYNHLLNKGIENAAYDWVFFCGIDWKVPDDLIERMYDFMLKNRNEIVWPMYRGVAGKLKMSDGGYLTRKDVLKRFGQFDPSLIGISKATFIFLDWALVNTNWYSGPEFLFELIPDKSYKNKLPASRKIHYPTLTKCRPAVKRVTDRLRKEGLWLV